MIKRKDLETALLSALSRSPAVVLLGPRQCGKTTLAQSIAKRRTSTYFDLEDPVDLARLASPMLALEQVSNLSIIDEVQRMPELFPILRVLIDRKGNAGRFLLLGSASLSFVRGVSESLAGRVAFVEMEGFTIREVGAEKVRSLWLRGGFPRAYLATSNERSYSWRNDFIKTFLERDIPQLGFSIPSQGLRRFWTMLAHFHGNVWNAAEFARSLGTSEPTARRYLDLLSHTFVVRQLQPWHENISKRQVKSPKVYIRDSGILHTLLSITTERGLSGHYKFGASWEGFALEQVLGLIVPEQAFFWATHAGAELDLLVFRDGKRFGFEFKTDDAPRLTKSLQIACEDLQLTAAFIVHPGSRSYQIDEKVKAASIREIVGSGLAL